MNQDLERLRAWIGRTEEAEDVVAAAPVAGLAATLDRDESYPQPGDTVPPGAHWLYFLPRPPQSEITADGHARRGGFLPPIPLPRRMWAGGRVEFLRPLRVGEAIRRSSEIGDVSAKEGRTGRLMFVRVRHRIAGENGDAIIEDQNLVFRDQPGPDEPMPEPRPAPGEAVWKRIIEPDPVMLFRYSALTFNGHRIHYDRDYVTRVEGYPGLIVHGPLIATLLLDLCRRERPEAAVATFDYRAVRPVFDLAPFSVEGEPAAENGSAKVWALDSEQALATTGTVRFAD